MLLNTTFFFSIYSRKYQIPVLTLPKPRDGRAAPGEAVANQLGMAGAGGEDSAAQPGEPPRGEQDPAQHRPGVVSAGDDFPSHHLLESITPSHHLLKSLPLLRSHASPGTQSGANPVPPWQGCSRGRRRRFVIPSPSQGTLPFKIILSTWNWDFCSVGKLTAEDNQRQSEGGRLLALHARIVHHLVWASAGVDAPAACGALAETGKGMQKSSATASSQRRP